MPFPSDTQSLILQCLSAVGQKLSASYLAFEKEVVHLLACPPTCSSMLSFKTMAGLLSAAFSLGLAKRGGADARSA